MLLNDMAAACRQLSRYQESLSCCNQALRLSYEVADQRLEAQALWNLGELYSYLGQLQHSIDPMEKALAIWVRLADRRSSLGLTGAWVSHSPT